jgi:ribosomal protein S21
VVEVKRKDKESVESLLRRFKRKTQQSGKLLQARKGLFFMPKKSKKQQKEEAKRKKQISAQRENLRRLGKLPNKKNW